MYREAGKALLVAVFFAVACSVTASATAPDATPLKVGVDTLPLPPGATDFRLYTPEGFDVLIAERIAERLGRELELVKLAASDRGPALARHDVDLVLGRLADDDPLSGQARIIDAGFRSGVTVAMRTDTDITRWSDLSGRTVCVSRGNAQALELAEHSHAKVRIEEAPAQSLVQVRTGACDAAIHDEALLKRLFQETGWQKFSATLPPSRPTGLVAAVSLDNRALAENIELALAQVASPKAWDEFQAKWASHVALEVYLDQDAPDCH
ncbi:transporter substrate-binding domain-containing protein [Mesorhizobium sp. DCY119]|uniref:amino acid ABC transporter substrate-binding protein n=1 Tax=Mesorhizobium sp. DCY119 TaxID=2108445 RepID=UPI002479BF1F|nr:transporter substrate-binding domain-containing protein [Mesorhizobium sp. DCY119]